MDRQARKNRNPRDAGLSLTIAVDRKPQPADTCREELTPISADTSIENRSLLILKW
jgi:hypothetical protein